MAFVGGIKKGKFDIPGDLARQWLALPANPNGRPNSDVLKPWINGRDVTQRPQDKWIIDFGHELWEPDAAYYEAPFEYVQLHVLPSRNTNRRRDLRTLWWRHDRSGQGVYGRIRGLDRFIATPTSAKHRLFVWCDGRVCPDHQLAVIARNDDTAFGILHSRFHELWSLRLGTSLEDRPRYTPTTTFETFPFPDGLTLDLDPAEYAADPRSIAIAEAARSLVESRSRWLHPPELVEWVSEEVEGYPKRPVARSEAAAKQLKARTLTNLYNDRPRWLDNAHRRLDQAVAKAYGWPTDLAAGEVLGELLALNERRAADASNHDAPAVPLTLDGVATSLLS